MRASLQFALRQIRPIHLLQTAGDPASEIAFGKIEKRVDTAAIDQSAIQVSRTGYVPKEFRHGCNTMGFLLCLIIVRAIVHISNPSSSTLRNKLFLSRK
jgi:hypothetical protein